MHAYILWIATLAYALHVVEELVFDWRTWASCVLKLPVSWALFATVNGVVVVLGIACSQVGWRCPSFALSLPALMFINGTFFHVLPWILTRGRFSPGLGTAVLTFYPVAAWAYLGARADGVLSLEVFLLSLMFGAVLMASPIVMLKLSRHRYFVQRDTFASPSSEGTQPT